MKKLLLFSLATVLGLKGYSQNCIPAYSVNAGPDVCNSSCVNLTATPSGGVSATSNYSLATIGYATINPAGTAVNVVGANNIDDVWSSKLDIGFPFCYFGNTYTQLQIGVNGQLHFGTTVSTALNDDKWEINNNLPNSIDLPGNTICAVFRDINPSVLPSGVVATRMRLEGSAPCRRLYVTWYNTPLFTQNPPCPASPAPAADQTFQAILYEGSNIIEVHILKSNSRLCWNQGRGIVGIQNENATAAVIAKTFTPSGTQWSVTTVPEAYRFTPNGPVSTPTYSWSGPSGVVGTGATVNVCPTVNTTYTVTANFPLCGGGTVAATDQIKVTVPNPQFTGKSYFCPGELITFNGSASTDIPNAYWEILESDQNGWYIPGGYAWNTWTGAPPSTFTFPANVPCGKYYKIKLAGGACWKEMNKVIYVACTCPCGTSQATACDLGTTCSKDVTGIDNTQPYYTNTIGQPSKEVWYKFKPTTDGYFEISTCGSAIDTYIHLMDENGVEIAFNDDQNASGWLGTSCPGSLISMINSKNTGKPNTPLRLLAGKTYYVVVEGYSTNQGLINLQIRACLPCPASGNGSSDVNAIDLCVLGCSTTIERNNGDAIFSNTYGTDKTEGQASKDVWYTFTVPTTGNGWTINTCGSTLAYPYIHLLKADKTHFKSSHVSVDGASCTNMNGMVENISLPAGTYYLVTEGAGTATGTIRVNIGFCYARPTSVEENTGSELDLQVFPNPFSTSTTIKITGSQQEKVSVEIISVNGARVYKNENHAVGEEITLGENFPAGIYFVKMNAGNEMKTVKLVKLQ